MILWWIGNLLLFVAVIPVVLLLLNRVLRPVFEIDQYAKDVLEHGRLLSGTLDAVPRLERTRELAGTARQSAQRYVATLQRVM